MIAKIVNDGLRLVSLLAGPLRYMRIVSGTGKNGISLAAKLVEKADNMLRRQGNNRETSSVGKQSRCLAIGPICRSAMSWSIFHFETALAAA